MRSLTVLGGETGAQSPRWWRGKPGSAVGEGYRAAGNLGVAGRNSGPWDLEVGAEQTLGIWLPGPGAAEAPMCPF